MRGEGGVSVRARCFLGEVCFVSMNVRIFGCADGGDDDLRVRTWWYGGETGDIELRGMGYSNARDPEELAK